MILLHCACGTDSTVEDNMAGRKVRCPSCDRVLDVPAAGSQPAAPVTAAPAGKFKGYTSKAAGIVLGLLLLATLVIPFRVSGSEVLWPTEALAEAWDQADSWSDWQEANWAIVWMLGMWVGGGLLLVAAIALRRLPLAILYLVVAVLLVVALAGMHDDRNIQLSWFLGPQFDFTEEAGPAIIALLGAFLLVNSLRAKMGGRVVICVVQLLLAAGLAGLAGYGLYEAIPEFRDSIESVVEGYEHYASQEQDRTAFLYLLFSVLQLAAPLVLAAGMAVAGLVAFLHGVTFSKRSRMPARLAMFLAVQAVVLWYFLPRYISAPGYMATDATAREFFEAVCPMANTTIFLLAVLTVPVAALAGLIADTAGLAGVRPTWQDQPAPAGAQGRAPSQTPPGSPAPRREKVQAELKGPQPATPGQRLDRLKSLHDQGKLSDEEYQKKRQEILKEL